MFVVRDIIVIYLHWNIFFFLALRAKYLEPILYQKFCLKIEYISVIFIGGTLLQFKSQKTQKFCYKIDKINIKLNFN